MKDILATPGPTPVPPSVLSALSQPIIYHRAPVFADLMAEVRQDLKTIFRTREDVLVLAASGTGAMEAAICNLTSPGEKVISIEAGKFGERWGEISRAYGLQVVTDKYEYGQSCEVTRLRKLLQENPETRLVCVQACETSTGIMHPVRELAALVRERPETLFVVDGITGIGVFDVPMDDWGIDVLLGGSQKAFMLPPGLAFIALSEKAWRLQGKSKQPKYYFDLATERKAQQKNQTAYTPAVNLVQGLKESLRLIVKVETLEKTFLRHAVLAEGTRAAVQALGLKLFTQGTPANGVTAVLAPEGIGGDVIVKHMRNRHGITIAGGQGSMKGKIFRLAHMGYFYPSDMAAILAALEVTLRDVGYKGFELGQGLHAALGIFAKIT